MMPEPTESEASLIPHIDAAGENDSIDAKGPMEWDGAEHSAGLAKDIMAFTNSRDGGAIVIGKRELSANEFDKVGLTDKQAGSFDTTNVAKWLNAHCQPDVSLVCYRVEHESKVFIVIIVKEFRDVPVICTKAYQSGRNTILRKGTLYVRTANAESAPLSTVNQVRALIGLATTKRADEMLAMFKSMMSGQPLIQQPEAKERYAQEVAAMRDLLDPNLGRTAPQGSWTLMFWPTPYTPNRWETDDLRDLLRERSIQAPFYPFPKAAGGDVRFHDRGIFGEGVGDAAFSISESGLFMYRDVFGENTRPFEVPWPPDLSIAKGKWLDFSPNMLLLALFFSFMSQVAHRLEPGDKLTYQIEAVGLRGRALVTTTPRIRLEPREPCGCPAFRREETLRAEDLRAGWEDECVRATHHFFRLFGGDHVTLESLRNCVEKIKQGDLL